MVIPSAAAAPWIRHLAVERSNDRAATWTHWTQGLIAASALVRCVFAATTGVSDTEAYYVSWARFPSWSYYDHAPGIAWLCRAVAVVSTSPQAARLVPLACSAALTWLLYRLGARLFSPRAGFLAALAVTCMPVAFFMGIMVNPEAPLGPLWVGYLLLLDALPDQREGWRPLVIGAVIGLAFLCKYTAVLLVPLTVAYVALTPRARPWLRRGSFYLAGLVALLVAMPVIAWNARHGWPTVHLHLSERMPPQSGGVLVGHAWHFVWLQLVTFNPVLVPGLLVALGWCWRQARYDDRFRLLALASVPVGAFFALIMIRASNAEFHWTMVVYFPLAIAAGAWLDSHLTELRPALGLYLMACLVVGLGFPIVMLVHTRTLILSALPGYTPEGDVSNEDRGWDMLRTTLRDGAKRLGPGVVVAGSNSVLCGQLVEALNDLPPVYCVSQRRTEFDFIGRRWPPEAAPILYIDSGRGEPVSAEAALPGRACQAQTKLDIWRGQWSVRQFRITECGPVAPPPLSTPVRPSASAPIPAFAPLNLGP